MKKLLKSGASIFLAITIIFSSAYVGLSEVDFSGVFEVRVEASTIDVLTFTLNDDGESYSVTDCNESVSGSITIPLTYKNLPVTSIGGNAFYNCTNLTSITITDNVTSIDHGVFQMCENLISVMIGKGVVSICSDAFNNCKNLVSVIVDDNNKNYSSLYGALFNKKLTEIILCPEGIGGKFVIPNSVTDISSSAFSNCRNITSVTIPEGVSVIDSCTFENCTNLAFITMPNSITRIGHWSFNNCSSLVSVIIPNNAEIRNWAFQGCTSLTSITIPEGVASIGVGAFQGCTSLVSINVDRNNSNYSSVDGVFFNKEKTVLFQYPAGRPNNTYKVPDSVKSIESLAFEDCTNLASIIIPDSVINISSSAFYNTGYYNNENNWKSGVLYIGNHLIAANKYDEENYGYIGNVSGEYVIKNGTKTIADHAFRDCVNLNSITIPDSITSIGVSAFTNTGYSNNENNWENGVLYIGNYLIGADSNVLSGSYTVKNGTKIIADSAFSKCQNLTSVVVPDSVTHICEHAFYNCRNLKSVTIGNNVKSIGANSFSYCENLADVDMGNGVISIEEAAFYNCKFTTIIIPESLANIEHYALGYMRDYNTLYDSQKIEGFTICGAKSSSAELYADKNGFKFIDVNHTQHIPSSWITDKKATVYRAGSKHKECTECGEVLKTATIKQLTCSKPVLKKVYNENSYVKITWGTVKGADKYYVYRKTGTGDYKYIGSTTNKYFNDKKAGAGKTCRYIVKAKNEAGYSKASDSKAVKHIDEPKLKTISNTEYGVKITWGKVTGAEKYYIYRKTSSGSYSKIGTTSKTYYTDKKAKSGTKYYYIVKAVKNSTTSASSNAKSILHLADPTLKTPSSTKSGVKLTWSKVTGAAGYIIYRKTGSGSYTKLKTEKGVSNLSYTDSSAKKGKKYTYKVKAYYSKTYSAYSNTKTITDKY